MHESKAGLYVEFKMADESNNNKQQEENIFNYLVNNIDDINIEISIETNEKKRGGILEQMFKRFAIVYNQRN